MLFLFALIVGTTCHHSPAAMNKAAASYIGVHDGGIRRNARISATMPVDLGIDPGVLAAEVTKFVATEERGDCGGTVRVRGGAASSSWPRSRRGRRADARGRSGGGRTV